MRIGRLMMGGLYITAGALHFALTTRYVQVMPPYLPAPRTLVWISGAAEIAGGIGVLLPNPKIRRAAAWGLIALLVAVSPANLNMALHPELTPGVPVWALWLRLPLQLPLIWWAWRYADVRRLSFSL
jgi:uncharacterized membrane protein